jgi:hypothetical protein
MAWNNNNSPGTNWQGGQSFATIKQLNSSIGYTSTIYIDLSTTTGVVSNVLQGEISSIIAGGTTSLWANYPAIANVDMAGFSLNNAKFLSTMDLQCSSINGVDIGIFNSTITLQGVTITNNSIITQNITQQKSAFEQIIGGINAVAATVSEINKAAGGFLSNVFGVVQQVYYGAKAAGAVIELATDVVELATASQALSDSRTINTISGNNINTSVYETFNHTAQLQFSTLMSTTLTYYRTTDAPNPNMGFGREIIISSYISAGTKCLRSIGDPMNMPIASTILLSTTNFVQSFGQWTPILNNDNNLNANSASISSLKVSSIYGNWFSTGTAFISSINGTNIATILNPTTLPYLSTTTISSGTAQISSIYATSISSGTAAISSIYANYISSGNAYVSSIRANSLSTATASISSINTNAISTGTITISNLQAQTAYISTLYASSITVCNIIDNYVSTTTGYFDIIYASSIQAVLTPFFQSTTTQTFDSISSIYQPIINAQLTGSDSGPQQFGLQDYQIFDAANIGFWNGKAFKNFNAGTSIINFISGGVQDGAYIDISVVTGGTINVIDRGGQVISLTTAGTTKRITWKASLVVFAVTTAPAPTITTLGNSFQLGQSFDAVLLSTPYQFIINAGETVFNAQLTANDSLIVNGYTYLSTLTANTIGFNQLQSAFFSTTTSPFTSISSAQVTLFSTSFSVSAYSAEVQPFIQNLQLNAGNVGNWGSTCFLVTTQQPYIANQNYLQSTFLGQVEYSNNYGQALLLNQYNPGAAPPIAWSQVPANSYRRAYNIGAGWTLDSTTTPGLTTVGTSFAIQQTVGNTTLTTPDQLTIDSATLNILGTINLKNATYQNLSVNEFVANQATVSTASISTLSTCNANIFRINGGTFYSAEVGTNVVSDYFTLSTAFTTIGLTQFQDSYNNSNDNLVPVNLFKSQLSYCNYPGWSGTYTGINLVYINSNGDVYLNGNPSSIPRNFNIFKAVVTLEMVTSGFTIPSLYFETPSQNFKALSLSNNIYAFLTFNSPSNPFSLGTNGPGSYTPGTTYTGVTTGTSYQLTLTQTGGAANKWQFSYPTITPYGLLSTTSLVAITHAPNDRLKFTAQTLTMSAVCNVDFFTGNVTFNQRQAVRWDQGSSVNIDAHGGNWAYGETNVLLTNPYNGLNYTTDWEPTCVLETIRPNQQNLAINAFIAYVFIYNGFWYCKVFIQTATVTGTGNAHDVPITLNVTMTPKPLLAYANPNLPRDEPDFSTLYGYSSVFSRLAMPEMEFSSITASTITIQALENISFNAATSVPTFLGTGSISLNAKNSVNLMTNYDIIAGADREIDMTGASTIRFTSPEIRAHGLTTVKIPGTSSIPAVSALAITNGNDYAGTQNKSQIEFQFYGGGFNHYISTRHNANVTYDVGNAIDFWLYSVTTGGDPQTASSSPGTGNINVMSITAGNVVMNRPLYSISDFNRRLSGSDIVQPIIQYGTTTGSGASGSVTVTLPVAYTSSNSYVAFASMMDVDAARMSVNRDSSSQITIYWFQAGSGTQTLGWNTMGS